MKDEEYRRRVDALGLAHKAKTFMLSLSRDCREKELVTLEGLHDEAYQEKLQSRAHMWMWSVFNPTAENSVAAGW